MANTVGNAEELAREFYRHLGEGRIEDAVELLAPDIVIDEAPGLPYGGEFHGRAGFMQLATRLDELAETELLSLDMTGSGDTVAVHMVGRFTARATGESADTEVVELFTVRDGQITKLNIFYKEPAAIAALAPHLDQGG